MRWWVGVLVVAVGCGNPRLEAAWCADVAEAPDTPWSDAPTYYEDVKPILDARCVRCHTEGGIGHFPLERYGEAFLFRDAIAEAVASRRMPPYLAAPCCAEYAQSFALHEDEIATITRWVETGAAEGDEASGPRMTLAPVGGLSRVDVRVTMPEPYMPTPRDGSTDDLRCFVLDWPHAEEVFITGMNPVPGTREVVHHLVVAAITGGAIDIAEELDAEDPEAGFDCAGGLGAIGIRDVTVLGGSLLGSDFPGGVGRRVPPGAKLLLNVHYTTEVATRLADQTTIEFKIDAAAEELEGLAVANPAWLVGDGMDIDAGDADAAFWFQYEPAVFARGDDIVLRNVTPHMHWFGKRMRVHLLRADGTDECLLEIPAWDFGWEQPFWLAEPRRLGSGDRLYVECIFDNSAANQLNGEEPRDIGWGGNNQDMCAAFLNYTRVER